ncbi:site-2 protease family protein [Candidatus Nanosynbacter featherlites]|uniref:Site-2 protease family protein n=1 Tax=Candidatus Nanosynbacter featherlites TaxID=2572088 RepID=A0A4P9A2H1_9BACT|nr:site-2 protease family protein [Candidatus Nanosynbacter featherlites]QCT41973.1 site-2 protease family protein [Candidatus Nanosynbacter featherlites]
MNFTVVIITLLVILVSMTIHEAMHAFMGYFLGDQTAKAEGRLSLNPIRHIDPFLTILLPLTLLVLGAPVFGGAKPVPFNPHKVRFGEWGVALVAIVGPLTNLVLAFTFFGIGVSLGFVDKFGFSPSLIGVTLQAFVFVNLGFFAFNMIPIPPLDGSRVLYALAPDFVRNFMRQVEQYGLVIIMALVMVGSPFISLCMNWLIIHTLQLFILIFSV